MSGLHVDDSTIDSKCRSKSCGRVLLLCRDDKRLLFAPGRRYLTDNVAVEVDFHIIFEIASLSS
jgi:hypothetical protein